MGHYSPKVQYTLRAPLPRTKRRRVDPVCEVEARGCKGQISYELKTRTGTSTNTSV